MDIELLYWDGCPSHPEALELVGAALAELPVAVLAPTKLG